MHCRAPGIVLMGALCLASLYDNSPISAVRNFHLKPVNISCSTPIKKCPRLHSAGLLSILMESGHVEKLLEAALRRMDLTGTKKASILIDGGFILWMKIGYKGVIGCLLLNRYKAVSTDTMHRMKFNFRRTAGEGFAFVL